METREAAGPTSFENVVLPHLDSAYTLARYLTHSAVDAEDAVQEAVLRALQYFHTLRSVRDARPWLLTIVRRECYTMRGGRASVETVQYDDAPALRLADPSPAPDAIAQRTLLHARVRAAIDELPERLREVVVLRELQQCSYEEIATITEVPLGTVMSRLSRARSRLGDALRDLVDPGDVA